MFFDSWPVYSNAPALVDVIESVLLLPADRSHGSMMNTHTHTTEPLSSITRQIFLGQTSEANDDIRTFLRLGFTEIHDGLKHILTMSNVAKPWPSYRILDDLVDKASGQFIYPATVLKFVGDPNYRPTDRLDIISSIPGPVMSPSALATNPLAPLDQLYSQILSMSSIYNGHWISLVLLLQ